MTNYVNWDDRQILAAMHKLQRVTGDLSPALRDVGEILKESTTQRFSSKTGPDGQAWEGNSDVTIERKGRDFPLTDGGELGGTIDYQLLGNDSLLIGSPMEQSAMMQFGGTKSEFPHLWGPIPKRPYLGVSDDDESAIIDVFERHLSL